MLKLRFPKPRICRPNAVYSISVTFDSVAIMIFLIPRLKDGSPHRIVRYKFAFKCSYSLVSLCIRKCNVNNDIITRASFLSSDVAIAFSNDRNCSIEFIGSTNPNLSLIFRRLSLGASEVLATIACFNSLIFFSIS